MAVTTTDVVTLMQGEANGVAVPNDGYIFFRVYNIKTTTIELVIEMVTRYVNQQISESTRNQYPDLTDDLILTETCYRLLTGNIMGAVMATGFSFTSLELTVDAKNFPDIVTNTAQSFWLRREQLLDQLQKRIVILSQDNWNMNPFNIMNNYYRQTAPPR